MNQEIHFQTPYFVQDVECLDWMSMILSNFIVENCGMAEVSVLRTHNTKGVSRVRWYTEDDTAVAGKDYEEAEVGFCGFNILTCGYEIGKLSPTLSRSKAGNFESTSAFYPAFC